MKLIPKDKKEPIVIDMVDIGEEQISQSLFSRLSYYEKKKWKIKYVYLTKDEIKEISKDFVYEVIKGE